LAVRLRRHGEEVLAIAGVDRRRGEPQIELVHQAARLERHAGCALVRRRDVLQIAIDQRQQAVARRRVAVAHAPQQQRNLADRRVRHRADVRM
jgi:hypothetical protein